jgi:hypothetical protein
MKKMSLLFSLALIASSCSDNAPSTTGNVSLKASSVMTSGKNSLTGKSAASTVVLTDFKVNIGSIELETDSDDAAFGTQPLFKDVKLTGPFLLDLLDANKSLSQHITSLAVPNAKYEDIEFNFVKGLLVGDMKGKTYLINGTINGKNFAIWSDKEVELEMDFIDPKKDFIVNSNQVNLNIKIQLDAIMAKIVVLANQNLLLDKDGDGLIEISTGNDDGNAAIGEQIRNLIENETDLDDKD